MKKPINLMLCWFTSNPAETNEDLVYAILRCKNTQSKLRLFKPLSPGDINKL